MEPNFQMNQGPISNGSQMPPPLPGKGGTGPVAGALVVVILLAAGALYFWGTKMNMEADAPPYITGGGIEEPMDTMLQDELMSDIEAGLPPLDDSDDLSAIEADLEAMDLEQFDAQMEAELLNF